MNQNVSQIYADIEGLTKCCLLEDKNLIEINMLEKRDIKFLMMRDKFVAQYSWAIPTEKIIKEMADFINGNIALEIGTGTGLFAYLLRNQGVQIIPTDIKSNGTFLKVIQCDAVDAVNKFDANVLITIWPPYLSSMAYNSLKSFHGNKIIYVGESWHGCCANDDFHALLEKEWTLIKKSHIPSWPCINDFVMFYERTTFCKH